MNCPKCGSLNHCKDGKVNNRQRHLCKDCRYRYTVSKKSDVKPIEVRRMSLEIYFEGLGFRAIGRILRISYVTVCQWIKEWGGKVELPHRKEAIKIVELDEIHTYIASKKTTVGYGLLLIDLENGLFLLSAETAPLKPD